MAFLHKGRGESPAPKQPEPTAVSVTVPAVTAPVAVPVPVKEAVPAVPKMQTVTVPCGAEPFTGDDKIAIQKAFAPLFGDVGAVMTSLAQAGFESKLVVSADTGIFMIDVRRYVRPTEEIEVPDEAETVMAPAVVTPVATVGAAVPVAPAVTSPVAPASPVSPTASQALAINYIR